MKISQHLKSRFQKFTRHLLSFVKWFAAPLHWFATHTLYWALRIWVLLSIEQLLSQLLDYAFPATTTCIPVSKKSKAKHTIHRLIHYLQANKLSKGWRTIHKLTGNSQASTLSNHTGLAPKVQRMRDEERKSDIVWSSIITFTVHWGQVPTHTFNVSLCELIFFADSLPYIGSKFQQKTVRFWLQWMWIL